MVETELWEFCIPIGSQGSRLWLVGYVGCCILWDNFVVNHLTTTNYLVYSSFLPFFISLHLSHVPPAWEPPALLVVEAPCLRTTYFLGGRDIPVWESPAILVVETSPAWESPAFLVIEAQLWWKWDNWNYWNTSTILNVMKRIRIVQYKECEDFKSKEEGKCLRKPEITWLRS